MTNKKACGAILFASAVMAIVMFILGAGCGPGGPGDLDVPPRETAFTPIYHPSNGGTFANPKDLGLGQLFGFRYEDDDQDGVTGQDDNLFWGGSQTWTDTDTIVEGRVVLRKHDNTDQYVVALYHTNPSPMPYATPDPPWRANAWATTRVRESYELDPTRAPYVKSSVDAPLEAPGVTVNRTRMAPGQLTPPMIAQYGLEERYEQAKRKAAVDKYIRHVSRRQYDLSWPNRTVIGELAGLYEKPEQPSLIPTPSPLPTPDLARNVDTSSLSEGDIVYFTTLSPFDPFVEAEVLAISPNSIIFGDTAFPDWTDPDIEDNVDWLQEQFDQRIAPRMRLFFGDSDAATYDYVGPDPDDMDLLETGVGDIDADGRVSILMTPVALDIGGGGYFYGGDLIAYDSLLFPITNEMNIINVTVFDDDMGYTKELIAEIVCNEYLHLIHFIEKTFRRVVNIYGDDVTIQEYLSALQSPDINEMETWVTEAFSSFAEDLAGYATPDWLSPAGRAWYYLELTASAPLTDDSHMLDVDGMGYLWFRYLMEQCGGMRFATTWEDDSQTDDDYVAERIGTNEHGIDFMRNLIGRKETGLFAVEDSFQMYDTHGGRDFPETFSDFIAMLVLDNARRLDGTFFNTNPKYNLNRNAVWPGGIDLTTGFESGMRTHEYRVFLVAPGFPVYVELEGPYLCYFEMNDAFQGTNDQGAGVAWQFGWSSPSVWYVLFEPIRDYTFTGQHGTEYDSIEFFFAGDKPWVSSYQRFKSGVSIIRVDGADGYWELDID